jgi:hypothetical protein
MPLLSTLGAASSQSFKGRGGPDLTMTASAIELDMSFGSFSVASDADIVSGDMLIVGQGSGDSDVTTFPNPVSDGYYSPPGTGFLRMDTTFSNYGSSGDSPQVCGSCGSCQKLANGDEPGTTISGFLPTGQDGYERSNGSLIRLRPNFDIGIRFGIDTARFIGNTGTGIITSSKLSLGIVPSTRCTLLVTVFMNHNSSNTNEIVFSENIDGFRVFEATTSYSGSGFKVSGLRYISMHVFPNGTNVGDLTISHINTASGARMLTAAAYEIGTS